MLHGAQDRIGRDGRDSVHCGFTRLLAAAFGIAVGVACIGPSEAQTQPAPNQAESKNITRQVQKQTAIALPSLSPIIDRVMPAVVNVSVALGAEAASPIADPLSPGDQGGSSDNAPLDELLRRFFEQHGRPPGLPNGPQEQMGQEVMALGSGFIIDPAGFVVTNNHVVANAEKVSVIFQDNSRHPAHIIGRDPKTDLALLKIDAPRPLPYVQWGDSRAVKVGDWVVAVGNPFGLGGTVTAGIVSALGRNIDEGPYDDFLQIDAPINRGNSGGPAFNLSGEVIGINTAIFSPSGGSVGIGFAIPSDLAKNIVDQLKEKGHVERGWLGVAIQTLTPALAKSFGLDPNDPKGALVADVMPNGPAAKAGLKQGDVIVAVNGNRIETAHDLPRVVAESPIGQKLDLTVHRSGKEEKMAVTVGQMPANPQMALAQQGSSEQLGPPPATPLGLALTPLTPDLRKRLRVPKDKNGVVVEGVEQESPAAALGIRPGDLIISVDRQPVSTPEEVTKKLKSAAANGQILMLIDRHGNSQFVALSVGNNASDTGSGTSLPGGAGSNGG
ncbi:MAG TPA: DegQ family serine endoprotease [Stellaceae bacterium]|nr:DegQ family serine endoprotease [Stellaceae bacterium]